MRKLLIVALVLALAVPALAEWGVPLVLPWDDPGDGPGPNDPGDGPILADVPTPDWLVVLTTIRLACEYGPDLSY